MATLTPVLGLSKPIVGADDDVWGNMWNANADIIDGLVKPVDLAPYLLKAGGAMTGLLSLSANATAPLHAVPLQQLNAAISGVNTSLGAYLPLAGGNMQGQIVLVGNAAAALNPVPLQQLDATVGNYVQKAGDTMTGPLTLPGNATLNLHAVPKQQLDMGLANYVLKAGDTMLGPLALSGNAVTALQAVPLQQMQAADATKIGDAPNDGAYYTRRNATWAVAPGSAISTDAPSDGTAYGRLSAAWQKVPWFTAKGNVMLGVTEPANISVTGVSGGVLRAWYTVANNYMSYCYYDSVGGTYRRLDASSPPTQIEGAGGGYMFYGAVAGAANSAFTWNTLFNINSLGSIGVGNITLPADAGGSLVSAANLIVSNAMAINMHFSSNGNVWRYRNNGSAGMIHMDTSAVPMINFYTAPVGTAGAQATISNVLSVRADGVVAFPWFSTSSGATIGADLYVNGNVFVGSSQEWHLYRETSSGDYINMYRSGNGWYDRWRSSDGRRTWCGNNSELLSLDGSGNLTASGTIATQGTVSGAALVQSAYLYSWGAGRTDGSFFMNGGGFCGGDGDRSFGIYRGSGMCILQFAGNWYIGWNTSGGDLRWWSGSNELFHTRTSDWLFWNPTGPVGGMGPYNNYSDRRGKQDIEPTEIGLPEILKLRPVRYTRIAPPESTNRKYPDGRPQPDFIPRSEIGFVAQEVRDVLPDAVVVMGKELPDGTGGLDDPDPTLGMTYDTITAALVNAVKTLEARLAALEATP